MSIPKEPRQLMINLMYLVLTAMLALNISSEILNAFQTINESIKKSNGTIVSDNNRKYQSLDAKMDMKDERERVAPYHAKAQQMKAESDKLYAYFEDLKKQVIDRSGGIDPKNNHIKNEGDIDQATQMFVEGRPNSQQGGDELKKKVMDFRNFALGLVKDSARAGLAEQIPLNIVPAEKTEENPSGDWARANFFHMPSIAAVTMFSKFQNDIRNTESMIVQELMDESRTGVMTFDAIAAIAVPTTSYALQGQKIEGQIMLAAYNKTVNPSISASTGRVTKVEGGVGYWETTASGTGLQTVNGSLSIIFNGKTITQPWKFQYMVGSAGASLQLDKMNVFYIGVDNPVTVSAAGYNIEDINLSIPGATVKPGGALGKYIVTVDKPGDLTASINASRPGTAAATVNQQKIRVKFIPDPIPEVAGKTATFALGASLFRVQLGVDAVLKNFDFDARFRVSSFKFSVQPKRGEYQEIGTVQGPLFSADANVVAYMKRAAIGDRVFLDNIKAIGPDGRPRSIGTIVINLN